jgi:hypothetical protein
MNRVFSDALLKKVFFSDEFRGLFLLMFFEDELNPNFEKVTTVFGIDNLLRLPGQGKPIRDLLTFVYFLITMTHSRSPWFFYERQSS